MNFPKHLVYFVCIGLAGTALFAQPGARPSRLNSAITRDAMVPLQKHVHVAARADLDRGAVDASMPMTGLRLHFKNTPAQQLALEGMLRDQQDPNSPQFHQWLTPEQFGDRFGLSQDDYDKVSAWLASEGFSVAPATRSRRWISFDGTAGLVEKTFGASIHRYSVKGELHYANANAPSVPLAMSNMVLTLQGLHDFKKKARLTKASKRPNFNFNDGTHALSPDDFATIYNVAPLYTAGFDGTGQKIAVIGQTNIRLTDQTRFRTRFNLPAQNLQTLLVPGQRDPGEVSGDIEEANLDIQWTGAVARNAQIIYVYAGGVDTSIAYTIDNNLAPVMSVSYGICEPFDLIDLPAEQAQAQQANAQGMTWLNASGDVGATDCEDFDAAVAQSGLAVDAPSGIPEITGVGGTSFREAAGVTYWSATNNANLASALSYIPEVVWNDTIIDGSLSAGGGGNSAIFPKPFWQTGSGVTPGSLRQTPDVALNASANITPYYVMSQGFSNYFGGTSAGTPAMAGIVAILNQYLTSNGTQRAPGLGNINPVLYRLATNNPALFHDVTVGTNAVPCAAGSQDCVNGQSTGYAATVGYDRATGLGSVDADALVRGWTKSVATVSGVVPSSDQIPVFQDATSKNWKVALTLSEQDGIATTLTGYTIDGAAGDLAVFPVKTIPARGLITGTLTLTPAQLAGPKDVLFTFTGKDASGQTWSRDLTLGFKAPQLAQTILGSINAASGAQSYAPGMLLSIFGTAFGSSTQVATAIPLPKILAGFEAFVNNVFTPLYFVSPGQANVQIPYETATGRATLIVGNPYDAFTTTIQITPSAPGIFAANGSVVPFPTVKRGDTTVIFITGEGQVTPAVATGATPAATTPIARLPKPRATPQSVTVGGKPATIAFIGIPSGLVGVTQVNFVVPADVPLGVNQVVVTLGTAASLPVNVTVTQ